MRDLILTPCSWGTNLRLSTLYHSVQVADYTQSSWGVEHAVPRLSPLDLRFICCPETPGTTCVALQTYISGWVSNAYFPALCHKSVVTRRFFFHSGASMPPRPHRNPGLECREMWRCEWGRKNGNGRKSGVMLVGSSLDCCAT
jgi:hypothetical protein